jgi:hypothetical protein
LLDRISREERLIAARAHHVRGEKREACTLEGDWRSDRSALAAVRGIVRMTAASLQSQQLISAFIEFVIAHRVELEAEPIHRLDRCFVVKQRGDQRAGTDQIARGDDDVVWIPALQLSYVARQHIGPASRYAVEIPRRLQVTVKIIESGDLYGHRRVFLRECGDHRPDQQRQRCDAMLQTHFPPREVEGCREPPGRLRAERIRVSVSSRRAGCTAQLRPYAEAGGAVQPVDGARNSIHTVRSQPKSTGSGMSK